MHIGSAWLSGLLIVLYVILPVALWVSILAAFGAWVVWTAVAGGTLGAHRPQH